MCMVYMVVLNSYNSSNADQQISFIQRCMIELKKGGSGKVLMRKKRILCLIRLYTEYTMRSNHSNATVSHSISHGHHTFQVLKESYTEEMLGRTLPFDIHINILDGPQFKVFCPSGIYTTVCRVRACAQKISRKYL